MDSPVLPIPPEVTGLTLVLDCGGGGGGGATDGDDDEVDDEVDNCPDIANPGQEDADGVGDACDDPDGMVPFTVRLRGDTGDERFEIRVAGRTVLSRQVLTEWAVHEVMVPSGTRLEDIQVAFVNDAFRRPYDRNLRVDHVEYGGVRYESEAPGTFGTGTWSRSAPCVPGRPGSEVLNCNGYFRYGAG